MPATDPFAYDFLPPQGPQGVASSAFSTPQGLGPVPGDITQRLQAALSDPTERARIIRMAAEQAAPPNMEGFDLAKFGADLPDQESIRAQNQAEDDKKAKLAQASSALLGAGAGALGGGAPQNPMQPLRAQAVRAGRANDLGPVERASINNPDLVRALSALIGGG